MSPLGTGAPDILALPIGPPQPKPTALTPGLQEAARELWTAPDGKVSAGLWEVGVGAFTAVRDGYHEVFHILSGRATLQEDGQEPVQLGPGDVYVTPDGWRGVWTVTEPLRKLYVTYQGEAR